MSPSRSHLLSCLGYVPGDGGAVEDRRHHVVGLRHTDRSPEVLRPVLAGVEALRGPAVRCERSCIYGVRQLGRPESFRRAFGQAEDTFGGVKAADPDPAWITYFDSAELAGVTGGRYLELSRVDRRFADDACAYIGRAVGLRERTSSRGLVLDQVGLAQAHLLNGELDEAVAVGSAAIDSAGRVHSDRVRVQLREFYLEIATRKDPVVAPLRQRIRETLAR